MKRLSAFLVRISNGSNLVIATVLLAIFIAVFLPRMQARMQAYSAGADSEDLCSIQIPGQIFLTSGAGLVDLCFFYTPDQLYQMAEAFGPDGRTAFVFDHFTFDLAFPLLYTFFFVTLITYTFRRAFPLDSPLQNLNRIAIAAMLFDLLENTGSSIVMLAFPSRLTLLAWLTAIFTALKWTFVGLTALLALFGLIAWLFTRSKSPSGETQHDL